MKKSGYRDFGDFILMVLLKDEPLKYGDLERRFLIPASHFELTAKSVVGSLFRLNMDSGFEKGCETTEMLPNGIRNLRNTTMSEKNATGSWVKGMWMWTKTDCTGSPRKAGLQCTVNRQSFKVQDAF